MLESRGLHKQEQQKLLGLLDTLQIQGAYRFDRTIDRSRTCSRVIGMNWSFRGATVLPIPNGAEDYVRVVHAIVAKTFPGFTYTTINTNKNFPGYLHVDSKNVGPSVMITVGRVVQGGELWYEGQRVPTLGQALLFDGNLPHMTLPYKGEGARYSIVCYTYKGWVVNLLRELRTMGFPAWQLPEWDHERRKYRHTAKQRIEDARTKIEQQIAQGEIPLSQQRLLVKPVSALTVRRHQGRAPYPDGTFRKKIYPGR
jgi:hypothetical protein